MQVWGSLKQKCERIFPKEWKITNSIFLIIENIESFAEVFCVSGCSSEKKTLVISYVWKPVASQSKTYMIKDNNIVFHNYDFTFDLMIFNYDFITYNITLYLARRLCMSYAFVPYNCDSVAHNILLYYFISRHVTKSHNCNSVSHCGNYITHNCDFVIHKILLYLFKSQISNFISNNCDFKTHSCYYFSNNCDFITHNM